MKYIKILLLFLPAVVFMFNGCIDDDPVAYNTYDITRIDPPVDKVAYQGDSNVKKVYIGHDLPVNITITAGYDEMDVPLQIYLLNVDDVREYENGVGYASDIRMYYCDRTQTTTISQLRAGTNSYGIVINVPAEDSRDELTNDFKTGYFYVLAEVNKNEDAETDAYNVYQKFKSKLDPENIIYVASDYVKKPDLSVEDMSFTGGSDTPDDVMVWYNVDLTGLPGIEDAGLDPESMIIVIEPSQKDRTFTGTVMVKSSSADALNVPVKFYLKNEEETISIDLNIYDKTMNGWVDTYYIPLLKANTTENITLMLQIPEDTGPYNYLSDYEGTQPGSPGVWPVNPAQAFIDDYPLSYVRHAMGKTDYGDHPFRIVAEVNPSQSVEESRFIVPNSDNTEYTTDNYMQDGNASSSENNTKSESLSFTLEKVTVDPNNGIKTYPYYKLDPSATANPADPDNDPFYRTIAIFWDGVEFNVGNEDFGANAEAHEGMFFYNYSLYSLGIIAYGSVFGNKIYLVNTFLNAQSHPYDENRSGFEFHIECRNVEGTTLVILSEAGEGFSQNTWNYPIVLWSKETEKEKWVYCFKFTLKAGIETSFTPGVNLNVNQDGSLAVEKTSELNASVNADASASIAGLATVGLYTYMDIITLSFMQNCYTLTELGNTQNGHPGEIMGSLNREMGLYLIGPKGYIDLYFEINFLLFTKRWTKQLFSFSTFRIPIFEIDFLTFTDGDNYNLTHTNWIRLQNANLVLDTSDTE